MYKILTGGDNMKFEITFKFMVAAIIFCNHCKIPVISELWWDNNFPSKHCVVGIIIYMGLYMSLFLFILRFYQIGLDYFIQIGNNLVNNTVCNLFVIRKIPIFALISIKYLCVHAGLFQNVFTH